MVYYLERSMKMKMFAMVETDGLCADHWFQRISRIGEFYKFEWFHK